MYMLISDRFGAIIKSGISQQSSLTVVRTHTVLACCALET